MPDQDLVKMFKALANLNRFRLFQEILRGTRSGFEDSGHTCFLGPIIERLNIGAPTVSHHLKELVNADLVETERQGKFVTCRVNARALERLSAFLDAENRPSTP